MRLYKRGEDGIVLIDQKKCRAWRSCVSACPYKKTYFNWFTGKSEKCILCFPRLETGQAPACFHSCVGRIRYLGVLLYDADRIEEVAKLPDDELVEGQRSMILDPHDPGSDRQRKEVRHFRRRDRRGAELARVSLRDGMEDRVAAAHRVSHAAHAVLRAADVAGAGFSKEDDVIHQRVTTCSTTSIRRGSR